MGFFGGLPTIPKKKKPDLGRTDAELQLAQGMADSGYEVSPTNLPADYVSPDGTVPYPGPGGSGAVVGPPAPPPPTATEKLEAYRKRRSRREKKEEKQEILSVGEALVNIPKFDSKPSRSELKSLTKSYNAPAAKRQRATQEVNENVGPMIQSWIEGFGSPSTRKTTQEQRAVKRLKKMKSDPKRQAERDLLQADMTEADYADAGRPSPFLGLPDPGESRHEASDKRYAAAENKLKKATEVVDGQLYLKPGVPAKAAKAPMKKMMTEVGRSNRLEAKREEVLDARRRLVRNLAKKDDLMPAKQAAEEQAAKDAALHPMLQAPKEAGEAIGEFLGVPGAARFIEGRSKQLLRGDVWGTSGGIDPGDSVDALGLVPGLGAGVKIGKGAGKLGKTIGKEIDKLDDAAKQLSPLDRLVKVQKPVFDTTRGGKALASYRKKMKGPLRKNNPEGMTRARAARRAKQAGFVGALGAYGAHQGPEAVEGTVAALVNDPGPTLGSTAIGLSSIPIVPLTVAANVGVTGKNLLKMGAGDDMSASEAFAPTTGLATQMWEDTKDLVSTYWSGDAADIEELTREQGVLVPLNVGVIGASLAPGLLSATGRTIGSHIPGRRGETLADVYDASVKSGQAAVTESRLSGVMRNTVQRIMKDTEGYRQQLNKKRYSAAQEEFDYFVGNKARPGEPKPEGPGMDILTPIWYSLMKTGERKLDQDTRESLLAGLEADSAERRIVEAIGYLPDEVFDSKTPFGKLAAKLQDEYELKIAPYLTEGRMDTVTQNALKIEALNTIHQIQRGEAIRAGEDPATSDRVQPLLQHPELTAKERIEARKAETAQALQRHYNGQKSSKADAERVAALDKEVKDIDAELAALDADPVTPAKAESGLPKVTDSQRAGGAAGAMALEHVKNYDPAVRSAPREDLPNLPDTTRRQTLNVAEDMGIPIRDAQGKLRDNIDIRNDMAKQMLTTERARVAADAEAGRKSLGKKPGAGARKEKLWENDKKAQAAAKTAKDDKVEYERLRRELLAAEAEASQGNAAAQARAIDLRKQLAPTKWPAGRVKTAKQINKLVAAAAKTRRRAITGTEAIKAQGETLQAAYKRAHGFLNETEIQAAAARTGIAADKIRNPELYLDETRAAADAAEAKHGEFSEPGLRARKKAEDMEDLVLLRAEGRKMDDLEGDGLNTHGPDSDGLSRKTLEAMLRDVDEKGLDITNKLERERRLIRNSAASKDVRNEASARANDLVRLQTANAKRRRNILQALKDDFEADLLKANLQQAGAKKRRLLELKERQHAQAEFDLESQKRRDAYGIGDVLPTYVPWKAAEPDSSPDVLKGETDKSLQAAKVHSRTGTDPRALAGGLDRRAQVVWGQVVDNAKGTRDEAMAAHVLREGTWKRMNTETGKWEMYLTPDQIAALPEGELKQLKKTHVLVSADALRSPNMVNHGVEDGKTNFDRAFDPEKMSWEAFRELADDDQSRKAEALAQQERYEGPRFAMVEKSLATRVSKENQDVHKTIQVLQALGTVSSKLTLGTSVGWLLTQFGAETLTLALSHPNPASWARAWKVRAQLLENDPEAMEWLRFAAGNTLGTNVVTTSKMRDMDVTGRAFEHMKSTPMGSQMKALRKLEILGNIDRLKGAAIREVGAIMEIERNLKQSTRAAKATWDAMDAIEKVADRMNNMTSWNKRLEYLYSKQGLRDGELITRNLRDALDAGMFIQRQVDRQQGNWTAVRPGLEEGVASALFFYPFVRFSLAWTFKNYPADHPVRFAVLNTLGMFNAQMIQDIIGEDPQFITDWLQVPVFDNDGKVSGLIPASRLAHTMNPVTELGGGGLEGPRDLLRVAIPPITFAVNMWNETDEYGQPLMDTSLFGMAKELGDQFFSLATPYREAKRLGIVIPPLSSAAWGEGRGDAVGDDPSWVASTSLRLLGPLGYVVQAAVNPRSQLGIPKEVLKDKAQFDNLFKLYLEGTQGQLDMPDDLRPTVGEMKIRHDKLYAKSNADHTLWQPKLAHAKEMHGEGSFEYDQVHAKWVSAQQEYQRYLTTDPKALEVQAIQKRNAELELQASTSAYGLDRLSKMAGLEHPDISLDHLRAGYRLWNPEGAVQPKKVLDYSTGNMVFKGSHENRGGEFDPFHERATVPQGGRAWRQLAPTQNLNWELPDGELLRSTERSTPIIQSDKEPPPAEEGLVGATTWGQPVGSTDAKRIQAEFDGTPSKRRRAITKNLIASTRQYLSENGYRRIDPSDPKNDPRTVVGKTGKHKNMVLRYRGQVPLGNVTIAEVRQAEAKNTLGRHANFLTTPRIRKTMQAVNTAAVQVGKQAERVNKLRGKVGGAPTGIPQEYKASIKKWGAFLDSKPGMKSPNDDMVDGLIPASMSGAEYLAKIIQHESGWNAETYNDRVGATGIGQFIPGTRQGMIDQYGVDPWASGDEGIQAAALYLSEGNGGLFNYNSGYPNSSDNQGTPGTWDGYLNEDVGATRPVSKQAAKLLKQEKEKLTQQQESVDALRQKASDAGIPWHVLEEAEHYKPGAGVRPTDANTLWVQPTRAKLKKGQLISQHGGVNMDISEDLRRLGLTISKRVGDPLTITSGLRPGDDGDHGHGGGLDIAALSRVHGDAETETEGNRIAYETVIAAGGSKDVAQSLVDGAEVVEFTSANGHRVQVLWKTYIGGDHHNHVHVGIDSGEGERVFTETGATSQGTLTSSDYSPSYGGGTSGGGSSGGYVGPDGQVTTHRDALQSFRIAGTPFAGIPFSGGSAESSDGKDASMPLLAESISKSLKVKGAATTTSRAMVGTSSAGTMGLPTMPPRTRKKR